MKRKPSSACPCGTRSPYAECCSKFHAGAEPESAEALMRARYAAFAKRDAPYLWRTLHSSHDDRTNGEEESIWTERFLSTEEKHARQYVGLRVVDTAPPDAQGVARVLFVVRVKARGKISAFAELSFFAQESGGWRYVAGILMDPERATSIDAIE